MLIVGLILGQQIEASFEFDFFLTNLTIVSIFGVWKPEVLVFFLFRFHTDFGRCTDCQYHGVFFAISFAMKQ